jgi:hypothetical protein
MAVRGASRACAGAVWVGRGEREGGLRQRVPGLGRREQPRVRARWRWRAKARDAGDSVPNRPLVFAVVHPNLAAYWG